ncbi:MAG: lysostaphin resistance A-like protein [Anaerolineales bacterium]
MEQQAKPPATNRNPIVKIFISPDEARLRAGWRLLIQLIILWILTTIFSVGIGFVIAAGGTSVSSDNILFFGEIVSALAVTLSVYIARGYLDRRSFTSLGLKWDSRATIDLLTGVGIALAMFALIYGVLYALGWISIQDFAWQTQNAGTWINSLLTWFFFFILAAWLEELLARGYWLANLTEGLNLFWGVLISSAAFSILHLLNPNPSLASSLGIFLAGLFLAYACLASGQLWLPIGLHLGWNFFEGPIFGFSVSGFETFKLINHTVSGPDLITGGTFGPEAGLILLPALGLGVLLIYFYTRSRPHRTEAVSPADEPGVTA